MKPQDQARLRRETMKWTSRQYRNNEEYLNELSPNLRPKIKRILQGLIPIFEELDDFETLSILYRCLMEELTYDTTLKRSLSYSFLGPLRDHTGVCEGIAQLLLMLMNTLTSCETYLVKGFSGPFEDYDHEGHAWNLIHFTQGPLAGKTYHCDLTWDLKKKEPSWFLKSDSQLKQRIWIRDLYPAADTAYRGKLYTNPEKLEEVRAYFQKVSRELKS